MNKEVKKFVRNARKRGWKVRRRSGHIVLEYAKGETITIGGSPSDWRSLRNAASDMRRVERSHRNKS